jgi:hypothetical protein
MLSFLEFASVIRSNQCFSGLGNGLVLSVAFIALTANLNEEDLASAVSSSYLSSMVGTTVGLATTSAVIQAALKIGLRRSLANAPDTEKVSTWNTRLKGRASEAWGVNLIVDRSLKGLCRISTMSLLSNMTPGRLSFVFMCKLLDTHMVSFKTPLCIRW